MLLKQSREVVSLFLSVSGIPLAFKGSMFNWSWTLLFMRFRQSRLNDPIVFNMCSSFIQVLTDNRSWRIFPLDLVIVNIISKIL